jgi:hypothetical protein
MSIMTNAENVTDAQREGYNQAVADCLKLMAKWFFMSNKNAKACVEEMRKLRQH